MSKKYIDVRVEFDVEVEDFGDGETYTDYNPVSVRFLNSNLDDGAVSGIGESAGQSDKYTVGVSNAMLLALGDSAGTKFSIRY